MPGLRTEPHRRTLRNGEYSVFRNLEAEGGSLRPIGSDESYTPAAEVEFLYESLGARAVQELDFGPEDGTLFAYAPYAGGPTILRDAAGTEEPIAIPAPGVQASFWYFSYALLPGGPAPGETATYAAVYRADGLTSDYQSGFGGVEPVEVTNDAVLLPHGVITGAQPNQGDTITNTTQGRSAIVHSSSYTGSAGILVIRESEKNLASTWQSGDALTWAGGSTTMTADEQLPSPGVSYARPGFVEPAETPPAGATGWELYRLHTDGNWYSILEGGYPLDGTPRYDTSAFPYKTKDQNLFLPAYPGPVDSDGIVEELIAPPDAQFVAEHAGSLFLACGRYLYPSERLQYRQFLDRSRLDAGADIVALVSRGDFLEVYTAESVRLLFGDYPHQYFRKTSVLAGPTSPMHVAGASVGSWVFVPDDETPILALLGPKGWEYVSRGENSPWLRQITSPAQVVVGAGEGRVYVCDPSVQPDGTYRALVFDWVRKEWREQTFAAHPLGFRYDEANRVMVFRSAVGEFTQVGTGSGDRSWAFEPAEEGTAFPHSPPERLYLDADGFVDLAFYVDDELEHFAEIPSGFEVRETPLPELQGRRFRYLFSGTGSRTDTEIRDFESSDE